MTCQIIAPDAETVYELRIIVWAAVIKPSGWILLSFVQQGR
jgi:hypothetical protein